MLCRALLAAIAISYLLCVLFLSGIQKEDLDVSLLKKLQRHNIDLNNDDFHSVCNKTITSTKKENKGADYQDSTNKGLITSPESTTLEKHLAELNETELEDMLTYLQEKKKTTTNIRINTYMNDLNLLKKNLSTTTSATVKSNNTGQFKEKHIQNIINFYEFYIRHLTSQIHSENNTYIKTSHENTTLTMEPNIEISNNTHINNTDVDRIGKIVAEYLQKFGILVQNQTNIHNISNTVPIQVNAQEIEQKFASSIDAIKKLNENIAMLQNKLQTPTIVNESLNIDRTESKFSKGLVIFPRESVQTIADDLKSQESSRTYNIHQLQDLANSYIDNYFIHLNQDKQPKNLNRQLETDSKVKNSINLMTNNYDNSKDIEICSMNENAEENASKNVQNRNYCNEKDINNTLIPFKVLLGIPYETSNKPETDLEKNPAESLRFEEPGNNEYKFESDVINPPHNQPIQNMLIEHNFTPYEYHAGPEMLTPKYYNEMFKNSLGQRTAFDEKRYINKIKNDSQNLNISESNAQIMKNYLVPDYVQNTQKYTSDMQKILNKKFLELQLVIDNLNRQQLLQSSNIRKSQDDQFNLENPVNVQELRKLKEILSVDNIVKVENPNSISMDMIIKIADSVKDIVLKELKKEINTSSATSTFSTVAPIPRTKSHEVTNVSFIPSVINDTSPSITSQPSTNILHSIFTAKPEITKTSDNTSTPQNIDLTKVQKATNAIEKFLELFEQYAVLKEKNGKSNENKNYKKIPQKMMARPQSIPIVLLPPPLPAVNPYRIKVNHRNIPIVIENFIPPVQLTNSPVPLSFNVLAPIQKMRPRNLAPLIQTNVNDIKPLPVPISQPGPINLNIVITTQNPHWTQEPKERWNFMMKDDRYPDTKQSLNDYSHIKTTQYIPLNSNDKNVNQDKTNLWNNTYNVLNDNSLKFENEYRVFNKGYKEIEVFAKLHNDKDRDDLSRYMGSLANKKYISSGNQQNIEKINNYQPEYNKNLLPMSTLNNTYLFSQPQLYNTNLNTEPKTIVDINSRYRNTNNEFDIHNDRYNEMRNELSKLWNNPKSAHQYQGLVGIPQNIKYSEMKNDDPKPPYNPNGSFQGPNPSNDPISISQYQEPVKNSQSRQYNELTFDNQRQAYNSKGGFNYQESERLHQNVKYNEMSNDYLKQSYDQKTVSQFQGIESIPQNAQFSEMKNNGQRQTYNSNSGFYHQEPERLPQNVNNNKMASDNLKQSYDPKSVSQHHEPQNSPQNEQYNEMKNNNQRQTYNSNSGFYYQEPERFPQNLMYNEMPNDPSKQSFNSKSVSQYQYTGRGPPNAQYNLMKNGDQTQTYNLNDRFNRQETEIFPQNVKYNEMPNDHSKQSFDSKSVSQYQYTGRAPPNMQYNEMNNVDQRQAYNPNDSFNRQEPNRFPENVKYNEMTNDYLKQLYDSKSASHYQNPGRVPQNTQYNQMRNSDQRQIYNPIGSFNRQELKLPQNVMYNSNGEAHYNEPEKITQNMKNGETMNDHTKQSHDLKSIAQYEEPVKISENAQYNMMKTEDPKQTYSLNGDSYRDPDKKSYSQYQELNGISQNMKLTEIKNDDIKATYNSYKNPYQGERFYSENSNRAREDRNYMLDPRLNKDNRNSDSELGMWASKYSDDELIIPAINNNKNVNDDILYHNHGIRPPPRYNPQHIVEVMPTKTILSTRPTEHINNNGLSVPLDHTFLKNSSYLDHQRNTEYSVQDELKQIYPTKEVNDRFKDLEKLLNKPKRTRPSNGNFIILPKLQQLMKHFPRASKVKPVIKQNNYPSEESPIHGLGSRLKILPNHGYDISSTYKNERNRHREDLRPWFESKTETNDKRKQKKTQIISTLLEGRNRLKNRNNIHNFNRPRNSQVPHRYTESSDEKSKLNSFYETSDSDKQYNNMDIRGFHEKLEGSDSSPDSPSDCGPDEHCTDKILSRGQVPLSSKAKKYSGEHFKTFLKTQQKVNSMLEKILATKAEEVKSVESI